MTAHVQKETVASPDQGQKGEQQQVTKKTRECANWWLKRLERDAHNHGYPWHVPTFHVENNLGEVVFEWNAYERKKKLSVYVEGEQVTYLRHWDWGEKGKGGFFEEGDCTWCDHALLLWHWLYGSERHA